VLTLSIIGGFTGESDRQITMNFAQAPSTSSLNSTKTSADAKGGRLRIALSSHNSLPSVSWYRTAFTTTLRSGDHLRSLILSISGIQVSANFAELFGAD
jgi:hypothetical protein